MPGTNAGTGHPLTFCCAICRRGRGARVVGRVDRVVRSGAERPHPGGGRFGTRMDRVARQYRCNDCGHVGWSAHRELSRAPLQPWGGR